MKKIFLPIIFLCFFISNIYAQYGQRLYYYRPDFTYDNFFSDGFITDSVRSPNSTFKTYVAAGRAVSRPSLDTPFPAAEKAIFTRVRFSGILEANKAYTLLNSSGNEMPSRFFSIAERVSTNTNTSTTTPAFVMAGSVKNNGSTASDSKDLLFMGTNPLGVPYSNVVKQIDLGGNDEALCVRQSLNSPSNFYVCGKSTDLATPARTSAFIMKISTTGSVGWVKKFGIPCGDNTLTYAEAISVIDDKARGYVYVAGNLYPSIVTSNPCNKSFIAKFSSGGALIWCRMLEYTGNISSVSINSIRATDVPNQFIITGKGVSLNAYGKPAIFFARIDASSISSAVAPTAVFAKIIYITNGFSLPDPVRSQRGTDAIMSREITGQTATGPIIKKSYFVCGKTGYNSGNFQGFILRLDSTGIPSTLKYYGSSNPLNNIVSIDTTENVTGKGLATFGSDSKTFFMANNSSVIKSVGWLIKSNPNAVPFSGITISACIESIFSGLSYENAGFNTSLLNLTFNTSRTVSSIRATSNDASESSLCWDTTKTIVLSSKAAPADQHNQIKDESEIEIFPNPAYGLKATMHIKSGLQGQAMIIVRDAAGRNLQQQSVVLTGSNQTFDLPVSNLLPGIYFVTLQGDNGRKQTLRLVRE